MSHESLMSQIKDLDTLYVQASESNDPELWESYKAKIREFEQANSITRIPRDEPIWKFLLPEVK